MTLPLCPLLMNEGPAPDNARLLQGRGFWFSHLMDGAGDIHPVDAVAPETLLPFEQAVNGASWCDASPPQIMGILNVTPDSFSDGGDFLEAEGAIRQGLAMLDAGAVILDIGGESTRPGAQAVPIDEEITRVAPVIAAIRKARPEAILSIDTRKAPVAEAALAAGADLVNDVSAGNYDPDMLPLVAQKGAAICLMHSKGDPEHMQKDPRYEDVSAEVFQSLARAAARAEQAGIAREKLIVDPGIGFGKTGAHNLALIRRLAMFHGLGLPVLLGASRKRFIGSVTGAAAAKDRVVGSVTLALEAARQAVQIVRVHDIIETKQAFDMWGACQRRGLD